MHLLINFFPDSIIETMPGAEVTTTCGLFIILLADNNIVLSHMKNIGIL